MYTLRALFLYLTVTFLIVSCTNKKQETSFYYWKTNLKFSETEKTALRKTCASRLYVRFFDVDKRSDSVIPLGVISNLQNFPDSMECIPVVYITNRTLLGATADEMQILATNIAGKIKTQTENARILFNEFQIDCDWSEKTRTAYFDLLTKLKEQLPGKTLSVTIRLHQVKYPMRSGIPPADKGVLMFYNMGKINEEAGRNSIYNKEDAEKYVSFITGYGLPLDYALPIFSWQKQIRNNKMIALISKDEIPDTTMEMMLKESNGCFKIKSPFLHKGRYYMEGDLLQTERINRETLLQAATILNNNSDKTKKHRIIFFDLDSVHLKNISYETLNETVSIFN